MARPNSRYFSGVINKIKASKKQENIIVDSAFKAQLKEDLMRRAAGPVVTEESGFAAFFSRWRYQLMAVPAALVLMIVAVQAFRLVVPMQSEEVLTEVPVENEEVAAEEVNVPEEEEEVVVPAVSGEEEEEEEESEFIEYPKIVTFPGRLVTPPEEEEVVAEPVVSSISFDEPGFEQSEPVPAPAQTEPVSIPVSEPVPTPVAVVPPPTITYPQVYIPTYPQTSRPVYRPYVSPVESGSGSSGSSSSSDDDENFSSSGSVQQPTGGFIRVFEAPASGDFVAIASSGGETVSDSQTGDQYYAPYSESSEESYAKMDLEDKIRIDEVIHGQYLVFFDVPWLNTIQKNAFVAEVVEPMAGCPSRVDYVYIYVTGLNTVRVVVVYENGEEDSETFRLNTITNQWESLDCCHYDLR